MITQENSLIKAVCKSWTLYIIVGKKGKNIFNSGSSFEIKKNFCYKWIIFVKLLNSLYQAKNKK